MYFLPPRIGRYEIKTLIGAGGMGSLYLARDTNPNTNRLVAIKLLNANLDFGDLRERFAREARALAALNHPNIVDIYDSGEFQGSPFIVMEYVRGETLGEKIKRQAPMSLGQKLKLMAELCSGLGHAHEAGIIHRDIKPANLMVDPGGRLKILDFGIARVSESLTQVAVQMTRTNVRIGTPGYMSPEQIEGGDIDRRSDVFAVGAVCYELLSYHEAFSGANTRQIENKVLQAEPPPLKKWIPDLDPEIESIVNRALAKDPDERYQDAAALEQAFERLRWRLGPSETPAPAARPTPLPSHDPGRKPRDSRADVAYRRSLAVYEEGAYEAARRFAIEALVEDSAHEGARALIERLGTDRWPPPPPSPSQVSETVLRTESYTAGRTSTSETVPGTQAVSAAAPTVLSTATAPQTAASSTGSGPLWKRFGTAVQAAAIVISVAGIVGLVVALGFWMWPSGQVLTITKPVGGTISSRGISCGTRRSDCSAKLARGSTVELVAEPDSGFLFEGFTGDCAPSGVTTMTAPRTCGATFAPIPTAAEEESLQLLTIVPPVGGTIISEGITCGTLGSECSTKHPEGKEVTLKALADQEYTFRGFTGECARTGETVMTRARTCGAMFSRDRAAKVQPPPVPIAPTVGRRSPTRQGGGVVSPDPLPPPSNPSTPDPEKDVAEAEAEKEKLPEPPAPPTPEAVAKSEIEKLLEEYRAAYGRLDWEGIRRVFPTAPNAIGRQLQQFKTLNYAFKGAPEYIELDPSLGTATVKAVAQLTPEAQVGSVKPFERRDLFKLVRQNGVWIIRELTFPPK